MKINIGGMTIDGKDVEDPNTTGAFSGPEGAIMTFNGKLWVMRGGKWVMQGDAKKGPTT